MLFLLRLSIFLVTFKAFLTVGLPQVNNNNNNAANRQVGGGISFVIPGLSLLGGNGGTGGGGNGLFGTVTVTRTIVSTVSTVTTASFRTCTSTMQGIMPCAAGANGRRRREVEHIEATPTIQLIIGATTINDPAAVTEYLESHKPSTQSVIYPKDIPSDNIPLKINPRYEATVGETTVLYPSHDTPETTESVNINEIAANDESEYSASVTTETPILQEEYLNDGVIETTPSSTGIELSDDDVETISEEKARRGLARTTTHTTIIRVTSVATSLATGGAMATLSVIYQGCLPQVLPVSGLPTCTT